MCFSLSQLCNTHQIDHALYLSSNNVNQEGMDTEYQLGNACSRKTTGTILKNLAKTHGKEVDILITEAITNEWLVVLIVDDYTSIHTNRRPEIDKPSTAKHMCTIALKIFKHIKAVRLPNNITQLHDPLGVNVQACISAITSPVSLFQLGNTYASLMPGWMTDSFFDPESQRQRLSVHHYCEGNSVRLMRKMDDLYLLNFIELELKSVEDFAAAHDIAMETQLKQYMKKFVVIQPGDWPAQFYTRQTVYQSLPQQSNRFQVNPSLNNLDDHSYSMFKAGNTLDNLSTTAQVNKPSSAVIPTMGPLHISLNSREHVFCSFYPFFKNIYEHLFPRCKLAEKPKPWRITMLLEVVYGAWTLIRNSAQDIFASSKNIQFATLLNLLDNYLPLVLSIYTITFKLNKFSEYYNAIIRIWVMFLCLKRRHYDKSPLVLLSNLSHWGVHFKDFYNTLRDWLVTMDEYPVENTHSILRAQTKSSDTAEQLTNKAKSIFQSKERQANFRSHFTPPKLFTFSQGQLKLLKAKCAKFLVNVLKKIHNKPQSASLLYNSKGNPHTPTHVILPDLFGNEPVKSTVLPLGYQGEHIPDES